MREKQIEKFKELLIFIVNQFSNNNLPETKLWKLMYFCEADYFEKNRETITGVNYYKNIYGPTPDKTIINEALERAKAYITLTIIQGADGKSRKIYKPVAELNYNYSSLTANEITVATESCEKYFRLSVNDIVFLSHKDTPFLGSDLAKKIDFDLVDYRDKEEDSLEEEKYTGSVPNNLAQKLLSYV